MEELPWKRKSKREHVLEFKKSNYQMGQELEEESNLLMLLL